MSLSIPGRTIVFDYGEVISVSPPASARTEVERLAGVAAEGLWRSYDAHRDALDSGDLSIVEYWRLIAAENDTEFTLGRIHELWAVDFAGWLHPEPGTVAILEELHDGGTSLALLSNAGFDFGSPFRFGPVGTLFDRHFVSAEMHDLKPSASIYETVLRELAITPGEMVFVDNKRVNVEAAEALGITGHVFTSPASLREFLTGLAASDPALPLDLPE